MKTAESIDVTRSLKEGFKYSLRVAYKTRLVVVDVQDEVDLANNIKKFLYDGVEEGGHIKAV
jgi:hypothetical protein